MADVDLVALEPDPKSRIGASRFIGHSPSAGWVLVAIVHRDRVGDLHGINAWPATGMDLKFYREGNDDGQDDRPRPGRPAPRGIRADLGRALPQEREAHPSNRSKVYSVRLSAEEQEAVERVADAQHLPASTLVRAWILERLDRERPVQGSSCLSRGCVLTANAAIRAAILSRDPRGHPDPRSALSCRDPRAEIRASRQRLGDHGGRCTALPAELLPFVTYPPRVQWCPDRRAQPRGTHMSATARKCGSTGSEFARNPAKNPDATVCPGHACRTRGGPIPR